MSHAGDEDLSFLWEISPWSRTPTTLHGRALRLAVVQDGRTFAARALGARSTSAKARGSTSRRRSWGAPSSHPSPTSTSKRSNVMPGCERGLCSLSEAMNQSVAIFWGQWSSWPRRC